MDGYSIKFSHYIVSQDKNILAKRLRHMKQIITKVTKAGHHPTNMNKDEGFYLSTSWKPTMCTLKMQGRQPQMALLIIVLVSSGPDKRLSSFHSQALFSTIQFLPTVSCINSHFICSSEM
jgi:hypothetical protein